MIDDLVEPSANGTVKYVDDTTVYEVVDRREVSQAQNAINEITQWSEINKFQLHPNKCKELRISFSVLPQFVSWYQFMKPLLLILLRSCRLLGISTSNSTKIHMMGPKINFLDILITGNWLEGVGEY